MTSPTSFSSYGSEYVGPSPLEVQAQHLRQYFPELANATFDASIEHMALPHGAEGYFIFPADWRLIASQYVEGACSRAFTKLHEVYDGNAFNHIEDDGVFFGQYLRESTAKTDVFALLREAQKGHDFLVVPGQFGLLHRERPVRKWQSLVEESDEFGFGLFETLIMLLTHPQRLHHYLDLRICCPGDEMYWYASAHHFPAHTPCFYFYSDHLKLTGRSVSDHPYGYGLVSGFLPKM